MPQGGVIQIQYDQLTTAPAPVTITASTYTKLTTLPNVTITPVSTSSKMKIDVMWNGEFGDQSAAYNGVWCLYRNSTLIKGNTETGYGSVGMAASSVSYWAADADSTPENASYTYFDEPNTTSAITYYMGFFSTIGAGLYTNRAVNTSTSGGYERLITNMTVTEIAG